MRILITGKNGQLGRSINKIVNKTNSSNLATYEFIFAGREELDMSNNDSIISYFDDHDKFDTIINCAAYTDVEKAEKENKLSKQINSYAPKEFTKAINKIGSNLLHISTDYVFDGTQSKPYKENQETNPLSYYGYTKALVFDGSSE